MANLVVIGGVALDYLSKVKDMKSQFTQVLEYSENLGGMAFNTAMTTSRLGVKTWLVSAVGKDFPKIGSTEGLTYDFHLSDQLTTRSFLFFDETDERIYFYRGAYHDIDVMRANALIDKADWVHFAGVAPCFSELIKTADHEDKIVSCNPGYDLFHYGPKDRVVSDLVEKSDFLILSSNEARHLNRAVDNMVNGAVIVTMGKNGSMVVTKDGRTQIGAHVVDVNSPFGAGDTYTGTFIASMLKEDDLIKAAKMASAAGSFAVEERTTTPELEWDKIEKRAKKL